MTIKKAHSICFGERILTAIVLTLSIVLYNNSWFDTFFIPVSNIQLEEVNQK
ncbi:MAG: hypothetical protein QNJ53_18990 [Pleurocapsa sp. MO_192.B19]|nr:hypothetical protein [Pleurocapsa sp. MO_192.B19]